MLGCFALVFFNPPFLTARNPLFETHIADDCRLQTPGSHAHRWGQLLRFDAGLLANIKAMGEDLTEFGVDELASCCIDPGSIKWQPRRQG